MSARAARAAVRGACPGVLRPMESGDGLLVRLKPRTATLSLAEVQSIAEAARRFGNGHIDLTRRANVQLRGVTAEALPALTAYLAAAGLLDAAPEIEAVRNVVVSPLAGLDPSEVIDVGLFARGLDRLLATDARLWQLPAKFGFLIDGGGLFSLDGERADLRLKALRADGRVVMALAIDSARGPRWLGTVSLDDAVEALHRSALVFLASQAPGSGARLRDGAPAVETKIRNVLSQEIQSFGKLPHASLQASSRRMPASRTPLRESEAACLDPDLRRDDVVIGGRCPVGTLTNEGDAIAVGLAAPFGRVSAEMLDALTAVGASEVRVSPRRAVYVPVRSEERAAALLEAGEQHGFITDPRDPRLAIEACPGAPACRSAHLDTHAAAAAIAKVLPSLDGIGTVHVSGCAKGCACSAAADLVLVGDGDRIAIVRNGRADAVAEAFIARSDLARLPQMLAGLDGGCDG